ncbi:MAG: LytR/AlgR family response regulator transcription factor [Draconibacterium sp.]
MKIKSIIVDDEKHGRENLAGLLQEYCPEVLLTGEANSVADAVLLIEKYDPDLVFLDIEMPRENGFRLLETIENARFEVIFVTAFDSYAIKAIRFSAADYILKPINYNELATAVTRVSQRISQKQENRRVSELSRNIKQPENPRIGLPTGDRIEFIEVKKIIHCKGEGNYTHIYLEGKRPLLVAKTLVDFEELLGDHSFVRTHKSHLVNLHHVSALLKTDGGTLELSNGDRVNISRRRKDSVQRMLKGLMR